MLGSGRCALVFSSFFFQAEDGIRDLTVTGVQTCALPISTPTESGAKADLATVTSDDFPQFLGPQRNGRVEHVRLSRNWAANPPQQIWKQQIGRASCRERV